MNFNEKIKIRKTAGAAQQFFSIRQLDGKTASPI
jgi:hypothetical protein